MRDWESSAIAAGRGKRQALLRRLRRRRRQRPLCFCGEFRVATHVFHFSSAVQFTHTQTDRPPSPPRSLTLRNTSHTKHNCAAFISMFCPKCAVIREMEMNKHTRAHTHTDVHMHAYVCCTSVRRQFVSSTSGRTFYRCSCCCCCLRCSSFCLCLCSFCLLFLNRKLHFPVSFIVAFV